VSTAKDTQALIEELIEAVFSVLSMWTPSAITEAWDTTKPDIGYIRGGGQDYGRLSE
jgi:hypothetical protein